KAPHSRARGQQSLLGDLPHVFVALLLLLMCNRDVWGFEFDDHDSLRPKFSTLGVELIVGIEPYRPVWNDGKVGTISRALDRGTGVELLNDTRHPFVRGVVDGLELRTEDPKPLMKQGL